MSKPLHVLQVEDSESDALLIVRQLERAGYNVSPARVEDLVAVREALAKEEWDVIICDYRLPRFDAPVVLKILQESGRDIPLIVVSGAIGEELAVEMMKCGAHDYLMKNNLARLAPAVEREVKEARARNERRNAERALRDSQEQLRLAQEKAQEARRNQEQRERLEAILGSLSEGILIAEPDGTVVSINPAASRLFKIDHRQDRRWNRREFAAVAELRDLEGRLIPAANRPLERALRCESFAGIELRVHQKTRTSWIGSWGGGPVRDSRGKVILAVVTVRDVTAERMASEELRKANTAMHQLTGQLLQLQDDERRRIARELHDGTVQRLTAVAMNLLLIGQAPAVANDQSTRRLIGESQALTRESQRELRTVSYLLHSPDLEQLGLACALRSWADGFGARAGLSVDTELDDPGRLDSEVETAIFRIAQESLANVQRHSGSATATVRLIANQSEVRLEVSDEGRGIPLGVLDHHGSDDLQRIGVGILGMRERARQLGGSLQISSHGGGTTVRAILPREVPR